MNELIEVRLHDEKRWVRARDVCIFGKSTDGSAFYVKVKIGRRKCTGVIDRVTLMTFRLGGAQIIHCKEAGRRRKRFAH
jgi:hypothetical protein